MTQTSQANQKKRPLVGLTIDNFKGFKPSELLFITSRFGVQFVEITESVFEDLENVKSHLQGIYTGFHLPNLHDFGYDFSHQDKQDRIENLINLINENHQALNIQYCLSHPPEEDGKSKPSDEQVEYLLKNLSKIKVPLVLENTQFMSPQEFENFYQRAQQVLGDKVIGKCFDASHYFLSGNDPVKFIAEMDSDIFCFHLSDCKNNVDAHLPFGLGGQLPIDEILSQLEKKKFRGFINLELLPRKPTDLKALIDSYLMVVKKFSYFNYLKSKILLILHYPKLRKLAKKAFNS